jgi:hypothetical protein
MKDVKLYSPNKKSMHVISGEAGSALLIMIAITPLLLSVVVASIGFAIKGSAANTKISVKKELSAYAKHVGSILSNKERCTNALGSIPLTKSDPNQTGSQTIEMKPMHISLKYPNTGDLNTKEPASLLSKNMQIGRTTINDVYLGAITPIEKESYSYTARVYFSGDVAGETTGKPGEVWLYIITDQNGAVESCFSTTSIDGITTIEDNICKFSFGSGYVYAPSAKSCVST